MEETEYDKLLKKFKNNKIIMWVLIFLIVVDGISRFSSDIKEIWNNSHEEKEITKPIIPEIKTINNIKVPISNTTNKTSYVNKDISSKNNSVINAKNINNAPNYGNQVVGDVVINKPLQRKLNDTTKIILMKRIDAIILENKLPRNIKINLGATQGNEEARQFAFEIADFLLKKNYNVVHIGNTMWNEDKGFEYLYIKNQEEIFFDVGVIPQQPK